MAATRSGVAHCARGCSWERPSATSRSRCSGSARRRRSCSRRSASSRSCTPTPSSRWRGRRRRPACRSSSRASTSLEDLAAIESPRWFQLYWWGDPELAESLVRRAEAAGYGAIVLTVDTLNLGWRPRDLGNGYLPFLDGHGLEQFFSDPVFVERLEKTPTEDRATASLMALAAFSNLALTWDDLGRLREWTSLPELLKGILRGDDATRALDLGIDGIVVSNHGGRQVDGSIAALDALVEVRDAVGPDPIVLMDSGVRTAADVIKAVALGADAVLLGRPYVYGLAVAGQEGVEMVIRQLAGEIDLTMALAGARNVAELDRSFVV